MKSKFFAILALIFALFIATAYADGVNVDSGIKFISQTGDIIHTFPNVASSDYTMNASITVKNESDMQKDLILLVSVYDENYNLKKVMYDNISVPVNGEDTGLVPVTIPRGTQESDFICKASLWDSIEGKVAYRSESRFLDFNTDLYGIEVDGVAIENYNDETDIYFVEIAKENGNIKVYPKSGATSIEYKSINVPGISVIKLVAGKEKRQINIKTYTADDIFGEVEPIVVVPEEIQNISSYAHNKYFYNQLDNNWADVNLTNTREKNGAITSTATYDGTIAKDARVATFQPWERGQGTRENAVGAYTMHFGVTVNEVTSPLVLTYKYDAGGAKNLAVLTSSKVVAGGNKDGSDYIGVTAPYTINCFMNIQSGEGYVYVNDQLLYQGGMTNSSGDKKWHEVRIISLEEATDIKFVTTEATGSLYKDDITIQDVISAYISDNETDEDEPVVIVPEKIQNISSYALNGFFYNQLNNHWSNITLSDATNENGVITTTATHEGTLKADSRVATFQPWDKNKPTFTNATGSYTMHFGFTVNEINSPVSLKYRFDGNKDLISFSDTKVVVGGNMNGSTFATVTVPYTVNMFMNVKTCEGYVYVNDKLLYQGTMKNSSADTKWTEIRVHTLEDTTNFKLVTTAANGSVYNEEITIQEVIAAYMGDGESGEDPEEPPVDPDEPPTDPDEPGNETKDISEYALEGYNKNQINNNWANITLSDATDTNGVITTTATYEGTLASDKRIATFQPWAEMSNVGTNATDAYTMHFGFTVKELTSPIYLEYNYAKNGGGKKKLISLSDSKVVVGGSMDGSSFVTVTAPYTVDMFMNTKTFEGYIYVNDQLLYQGRMNNSSADIKWNQVRVFSLGESTDIKLVTTAATGSVYNEEITIQEVIAAYMGDGESGEDPEEPPVDPDEPGNETKDISEYALEGFNKKKLANGWAEVTLSDATDANGVITTTAAYEGTLASGKRIATFYPWEDKSTIGGAAAAYTMHFGFTVNEISAPVRLDYQYRNSSSYKTLLSLSDSRVAVGNDLDSDTYIEVQEPYTIDMFMNIKTGYGYIYVNGQLLFEGNMNPNNCTQWREVRVFSMEESTDIRLITTDANSSVYNDGVTIEDVIDAYITE